MNQHDIVFQDAIDQLGIPDPRSGRRHRCNLQAVLFPLGLSEPGQPAHVVDLSCGGAGLLVRFPLQLGQGVLIDLRSEQFPTLQTLLIQHVEPADPGELFVGGEWLRPLCESQVRLLLDPAGASHLIV